MEVKEAIKELKSYADNSWGGLNEAFELAIKALEKQIASKVKYNNRHGEGYDLFNKDYYNCPACGRRLRNKQHDPYCPKCGQALLWEE